MHRRLILLTLAAWCAASAGCAGGGEAGAPAPRPRTIVDDGGGRVLGEPGMLTTDPADGTTTVLVRDGAETVMRTLVAAYGDLGVDAALVDPRARRVGNPRVEVYRRIGNDAVSRFLSCGEGMTGPRADRDRIFISLVTTVAAAQGGSRVSTRLDAVAVDRESGNSGATLPCTTTGVLEQRLHTLLRARLAAAEVTRG